MSDVRKAPAKGLCDVPARISCLAERQGGHVTHAQLLAIGLGRRAIQSQAERGLLIRVHHGVYAVGHRATNPVDRAHAALLAAGPRSALAGKSAASFWGLYYRWTGSIELISPLRRRIPGVSVRESSTLIRRDIRVRGGIRVTSPARTLLDSAPDVDVKLLHRFHNELRMRRLITNRDLIDVADRNRRHPGAPRLVALAGASRGEPKRSTFEIDWEPFAKRFALPRYEMNVCVAGDRVDVLFTPDRLIVELDGWGTHGTRRAFEDDRDRDSKILASTGIPTVRITRRGLQREPREQARRIEAILAQRPCETAAFADTR